MYMYSTYTDELSRVGGGDRGGGGGGLLFFERQKSFKLPEEENRSLIYHFYFYFYFYFCLSPYV